MCSTCYNNATPPITPSGQWDPVESDRAKYYRLAKILVKEPGTPTWGDNLHPSDVLELAKWLDYNEIEEG